VAANRGTGQKLFVLDACPGSAEETDFSRVAPTNYGEAPRCSACGRPTGLLPWLEPRRAILEIVGWELGDFAFFGWDFLVSSRVRDAFEAGRLTGPSAMKPVEIVGIKGRPGQTSYPEYFYVDVPIAGELDQDRTITIRTPTEDADCDACGYPHYSAYAHLVVKTANHEFPDIFRARKLPGPVLASQRLAEVAREEGWKNICAIAATEFRRDPLHLLEST
jgi:hypothetical protein